MKLHLGCGKRNFGSEWIHIDVGSYPHLQSHDIVNLPFDDNTCDLIYSSHVIAYFDRQEAETVLKEWYRVLKPNGICRIATSDFEVMAKLYFANLYPLDSFLGPMYGKMSPIGLAQCIYEKTVYDFVSLKKILKLAGFRHVQRYDWKDTDHGQFDDHSQCYLPHMDKENGTLISLNVEGAK